MKICLINNLYGEFSKGGAERIVEMTACGLAESGHQVIIISTKPIFSEFRIQNSEFRIHFINSIYFNLNVLPKFLRLFWHIVDMFDVGSFLKVRFILKKEKPDVVMTHNLKGMSYLIPLAVRSCGIKHIHTLHDIQLVHPSGLMIYGREKKIDGMFAGMYAEICRWLFNFPGVVISPSKWLLEEHLKRGFFKDSRKVVMANPTEVEIPNSKFQIPNSKFFKFLYVGQIEEHKGVLFLIEAFKKLNPLLNKGGVGGFLGCELSIVGDGSKMERVKKLGEGCENIKFLGRKNKEEVKKLMLNSDCLIVPSLCYENSPAVIYEAFSADLPVIGADLGGISELLADGAGILFKAGDKEDLIDKMEWALKNRAEFKKSAEMGAKKIIEFRMENYIDKILHL